MFPNRTKKEIKSLLFVLVFSLLVSQCDGGCAEVDSMTEAVAGEGFLLGCISCKKREEVSARTTVDWHFRATGEETFRHVGYTPIYALRFCTKYDIAQGHSEDPGDRKIFHYEHPTADVLHPDFRGRLAWYGTPDKDVQIGAVYLENVTYNDTGTYRCTFHRTLFLRVANQHVTVTKEVELSVVAVANRELTAVIAEILMYVLIVALQLWLIAVLVYCYKKTWREHEAREERQALRAQKEALLESKDISPDGVQLDEHLEEH